MMATVHLLKSSQVFHCFSGKPIWLALAPPDRRLAISVLNSQTLSGGCKDVKVTVFSATLFSAGPT